MSRPVSVLAGTSTDPSDAVVAYCKFPLPDGDYTTYPCDVSDDGGQTYVIQTAKGLAADCTGSFNPYAFSASADEACGLKVFPLAAVHLLPGGGAAFEYEVDGSPAVVYVPPPGFQPATASSAELDE